MGQKTDRIGQKEDRKGLKKDRTYLIRVHKIILVTSVRFVNYSY